MKCENCGAPATVNIQKVWIKWDYNPKDQAYSQNPELLLDIQGPTGNENIHFCNKCFQLWKENKI